MIATAERLLDSPFLRFRSGALFSLLAYVSVAGLMLVYDGFAQGDNYDQLNVWIVCLGWCIVGVAVAGQIAMFRRMARFVRGVHQWVRLATKSDSVTAPDSPLEIKLTTNGSGAAGFNFVWAAGVFPPCGFVLPYFSVAAVLICFGQGHGRHAGFAVACLLGALVVSLLGSVVVSTIPIGLWRAGVLLRRWRKTGIEGRARQELGDRFTIRRHYTEVPIPADLTIADLDRAFAATGRVVDRDGVNSLPVRLLKSRAGGPYRVSLPSQGPNPLRVRADLAPVRIATSRSAPARVLRVKTLKSGALMVGFLMVALGVLSLGFGADIAASLWPIGMGLVIGAVAYGGRWVNTRRDGLSAALAATAAFDRARVLKTGSPERMAL